MTGMFEQSVAGGSKKDHRVNFHKGTCHLPHKIDRRFSKEQKGEICVSRELLASVVGEVVTLVPIIGVRITIVIRNRRTWSRDHSVLSTYPHLTCMGVFPLSPSHAAPDGCASRQYCPSYHR